MKTTSKLTAYEAPQAELLFVHIEQNFLDSQTGSGQDVTLTDERDFDDYFNGNN